MRLILLSLPLLLAPGLALAGLTPAPEPVEVATCEGHRVLILISPKQGAAVEITRLLTALQASEPLEEVTWPDPMAAEALHLLKALFDEPRRLTSAPSPAYAWLCEGHLRLHDEDTQRTRAALRLRLHPRPRNHTAHRRSERLIHMA